MQRSCPLVFIVYQPYKNEKLNDRNNRYVVPPDIRQQKVYNCWKYGVFYNHPKLMNLQKNQTRYIFMEHIAFKIYYVRCI